jgi:diguanylate cyclase (GGDEF)-like protein
VRSKILVVGGSSDEREVAGRVLRVVGFSVEEAADPATAFDLLDPVPDLILIHPAEGAGSITMSYELLRSRTNLNETPVLILTDPDDVKEIERLVGPGYCEFIRRPLIPIELTTRVRALLRVRSLAEEVKRGRALLEAMSITDELTGLANDRYLIKRMDEEILRCQRSNLPLSCIMISIDGMEEWGKERGEEFTNRVVRYVAKLLDHLLRRTDLLGRYDETRFCAMLPATNLYHAGLALEKLRMGVEMSRLKMDGGELDCTVSLGLAAYPDCGTSAEDVLRAALDALDRAKSSGRNRIAVAPVIQSDGPA